MDKRPDPATVPAYEVPYLARVPQGDLVKLLAEQRERTLARLGALSEEQADHRYAPEKWSVRQIVGHLADTERILGFRLLSIARGEKAPLPGFEEDAYVAAAPFESWTLPQALADYAAVREATLSLLRGLAPGDWERAGTANGIPHTALLVACVIAGHELHHLHVLTERYGIA
ncbi:DinB family protein [Paenibacillus albicereus]|uniref:DinB family protein n=1 Tax=Paenibacillus albicereus TaxID=2726185 RepID=A0A6H2H2R4_9BACL|nr:DinB family protein [Paenibacillus albicereus]QJC53925.1 DinB family protein [Paenibacillus albicereus]